MTRPPVVFGAAPEGGWRWLALASEDRLVRVWDRAELAPELVGKPATESELDPLPTFELPHDHQVELLEFGPAGRWLGTVSRNDLYLWDLKNRGHTPSDAITLRHPQKVRGLAFSPDGQWVATVAGDRRVRLWASDRDLLFKLACRTAGRNLTRDEWRELIPDQGYRETCQGLATG